MLDAKEVKCYLINVYGLGSGYFSFRCVDLLEKPEPFPMSTYTGPSDCPPAGKRGGGTSPLQLQALRSLFLTTLALVELFQHMMM